LQRTKQCNVHVPREFREIKRMALARNRLAIQTDRRVRSSRTRPGRQLRARRLAPPLLALDGISEFLVIDRAGCGPNCDEVRLDESGVIAATR